MLSPYYRTRLLVLAAATLCFTVFWWAGRLFDIPALPGYQASLLMEPSPAIALMVLAIALAACAALGTVIASSVQLDAGLVAASLGMTAWSFRGGVSERTWFWGLATGSGGDTVFLRLFFEMLALSVIVVGCWLAFQALRPRLFERDDEEDVPVAKNLMALGIQIVAGAIAVMLVAQSTDKLQVLAAAFLGGFAGPMASQWLAPTSSRGWHFAAPLVVGLIGYIAAHFDPAGIHTGELSATLGALARPLPLDYASAGPAGAMMGHWMARQWAAQEDQPAPAKAQPGTART